jgi:hypothetical protein
MARRFFKIKLSEDAEIQVFIETVSGLIINFVVKLVLGINSAQYEVIRFDSGHNCPHKDILDVGGEVTRKIWYEFLGNKEALNLSIQDLKDNYKLYIERFRKWLKK